VLRLISLLLLLLFLGSITACMDDAGYCFSRAMRGLSVCLSVALVHLSKAVEQNEIQLGDSRWHCIDQI